MFIGPHIVNDLEVFETSLDIDSIIISNLSGINAAILKLAKPVSYTDFIQPVCVDINNDRSFPVGTPCWVAGWKKGSVSTGKALKHVLNPLLVAKDCIKVCTWDFFQAVKVPFQVFEILKLEWKIVEMFQILITSAPTP